MGFTVVGPDRLLGSGHPDGRERLPPFLGLIESRDAGRTWRSVSLLGRRDFHLLEARRIFGFGTDYQTRGSDLLTSDDGGRSWRRRPAPEPLLSLATSTRTQTILSPPERCVYTPPRTTVGPAGDCPGLPACWRGRPPQGSMPLAPRAR
jgi:hypothetical protein